MASHTIFVDGYIGAMGYSKQFIRSQLANNRKNKVVVKVSSLGGSVDHALSIYDQFKEHGNVTVELSAFVASAATLLSLGAQKVRMNENSFYLIHKPMSWVDEWDTMNEDDIEILIEKLEKQKKELAKITLQMAKMYVKKTGRQLDQIISLMKKDTWLNAEEALEWGFVDEVFQSEDAINYLESEQLVALITANGMPEPPRKSKAVKITQTEEDNLFNKVWKRLQNKQENEKSIKSKKMNKQFINVNKALGVDSLESTDEGVFLNEDQLQILDSRLLDVETLTREHDNAITGRDAAAAERDSAVAERDAAISERDQARTELANAVNAFDAIDESIAQAQTAEQKVEALRNLLASKPGVNPEGNHDSKDSDATGPEEDWDTINNLPHNKSVDSNS